MGIPQRFSSRIDPCAIEGSVCNVTLRQGASPPEIPGRSQHRSLRDTRDSARPSAEPSGLGGHGLGASFGHSAHHFQ